MARHADKFSWIQPRSLPVFDILFRLITIGVVVYLILAKWDINLTGWLASAGVVGIAVGFAAKDTLANLFAGIFILADAPYKLGDFIVLGTGERGRVTDIGIRSTRILTRDDIEVTIPNSLIANGTVVNETGGPHDKRRVRVTVGVAYGSDVDKVKKVLMDVGVNSEYAAKIPEPRVRFREFGDSALIFQLMVWIDEPVLRGRAVDDLNTALYKSFIKEGIEIPFPQRVVHMPKT
jgi:small-conductance mechanosensitive channel